MGRYLGQHFLIDPAVIATALEHFLPTPEGILEVGPGAMALTEKLLEQPNKLFLVEKDDRLLPRIAKKLKNRPEALLCHDDILLFDFTEAASYFGAPFALISNLPYHISTPFLERLVTHAHLFTKIQLLLQKEVVKKVLSTSGPKVTKVSLLLDLFYEKEAGPLVPPQAFSPPPQVDSQFLTLTPREVPLLPLCDLPLFASLLHAAFNHRTHTLHWLSQKHRLPPLADTSHLKPTTKVEDLLITDWLQLFSSIHSCFLQRIL